MKHILKSNKVVLTGPEYANLLSTITKLQKEIYKGNQYRYGLYDEIKEHEDFKKEIHLFFTKCYQAGLEFKDNSVFTADILGLSVIHSQKDPSTKVMVYKKR